VWYGLAASQSQRAAVPRGPWRLRQLLRQRGACCLGSGLARGVAGRV